MKSLNLFLSLFFIFSSTLVFAQKTDKKVKINAFIDAWHNAAADANSEIYFGSMTQDAIYVGTDASERWLKEDFESWSKPRLIASNLGFFPLKLLFFAYGIY